MLSRAEPNDAARECGLTATIGDGSGGLLGVICVFLSKHDSTTKWLPV